VDAALRRRVFLVLPVDEFASRGYVPAVPASFFLRATAESDIPAVAAIYAEAVVNGTASYELEPPSSADMVQRWRELVAKGYPHIVATRDGAVLGYAYAGPYRPRPAYRFLVEDSIYVAPAAQGGGIGRALLAELIEISEGLGFRQMVAVIGDGTAHSASVGLHRALGFREIGVIEASGFKHGRWLDTVLMQRPLGAGSAALPDDA
jgi:phosphinothricin acetyltransferase